MLTKRKFSKRMPNKRTVVYLSHGAGPLPLLGDAEHETMRATLKMMAQNIHDGYGSPSAVLVVSAHWEASVPTITSNINPSLIYDYYGFPEAAYQIQYPVKGQPELAQRVYDCLSQSSINVAMDRTRGFDHGVFVPLKIMYPNAEIPCVQLSLSQTLDADLHIQIGAAIKKLHWDNLLVIGSGLSFHNLPAFFTTNDESEDAANQAFQTWLKSTVNDPQISEQVRREKLIHWIRAPYARYCHPTAEHLLPLHVCYGITGRQSDKVYDTPILKKQTSMFIWQI